MLLNDMLIEVDKQLEFYNNYVPLGVQVGDDVYYDLEDLWHAEGESPVGLPSAPLGDKNNATE